MSCPQFEGKMCAGQGECSCGKCRCEEGYTGDDCSCSLDTTPCTEGGEICNGHGTCDCGKCVCHQGFTGLTCGISAQNELDDKFSKLDESIEDEALHEQVDDEKDAADTSKEGEARDLSETAEEQDESARHTEEPQPKSAAEGEQLEDDETGIGGGGEEHEEVKEEEKDQEKGDMKTENKKVEDAGEFLPPDEDDEAETATSSVEKVETATDEVRQEPVRGEVSSGSLRITSNLLALLLALKIFWC